MTVDDDAAFFRRQLLEWHATSERDFPWRPQMDDPYRILIAEVMLRRTRAAQVARVYEEFFRRFPSPADLVAAREADVERVLRPLGLAWRVPAFRQLAIRLVELYNGQVPDDRASLMSLPGVGEYVADAVLCFAFNRPVAIVDTNTVRIAGRYFGFPVHAESRRRAPVRRAVELLVDPSAPRRSNLALLDFGALICTAKRPLCHQCPVAVRCRTGRLLLSQRQEDTVSDADND